MGIFGNNGQNVADETRRLFVPPEGYMFNQNDLEGAEAVAVALLVGEGHFRECVRLGIKHHNFGCIHLFPHKFADYIPADAVPSLVPKTLKESYDYKPIAKHCKSLAVEYFLAKKTIHGFNYGMGWRTHQDNILKETGGEVVLTAKEAKSQLETIERIFPEIKVRQALVEKQMELYEQITNLFNHPAKFVKRFTANLARTGISWAPQSTVGVATVLGAIRHQQQIVREHRRWHIHNIVHDSILQSAPTGEIEEASVALANNMTIELTSPVDNWKWKIGVERQIGRNWGKYDEKDNPDGLKVI
jgi:hypothetical protein